MPQFPYCVPVIYCSRAEVSWLHSERLRAIRDLRQGLGGYSVPRFGDKPGLKAYLTVHERGLDGHLRASVVVEVPGTKQRYIRRLTAVLSSQAGEDRAVPLRLG